MKNKLTFTSILLTQLLLSSCGSSNEETNVTNPQPQTPEPVTVPTPAPAPISEIDQQLNDLIAELNLTAILAENTAVTDINSSKAQLGKKLFHSKNLGGAQDAACVSCHHPSLGGGDDISLSVGVDAVNALDQASHDLLGTGRFNDEEISNLPSVPRNAPTVFNIVLNDESLFWDGRVESNRNNQILTPDSSFDEQNRRLADQSLPDGASLAAAQARFPVTSAEEMRSDFLTGEDNSTLRNNLAQRFDNSLDAYQTDWFGLFAEVYGDVAISFDQIADAIAEYENSMLFINSPWNNYLAGNNDALTEQQKTGAVLFFTTPEQGGAGCINCHSGAMFTDNNSHLVAFPQIGIGKGNESNTLTSQDFGRENISQDEDQRFHFKTPSLLNVEVTAPYGHTGAYQTLEETVAHYDNPQASINRLFAVNNGVPFSQPNAPYCQLPQIADLIAKNNLACENIFPDAYQNSQQVVSYLDDARQNIVDARAPLNVRARLSQQDILDIAEFLRALTDPCVKDRACLSPWIVEESERASFPDNQVLIGHDSAGNTL